MKKFLLFVVVLCGLLACPRIANTEKFTRARVVKLYSGKGSCSGVQVKAPSGANYILTAAHCQPLEENGSIYASLDSERGIPRRVIEASPVTDLMLLEGMPELTGVDVAESAEMHAPLSSFTHGRGFDTHKSTGELIQREKIKVLDHLIASDEDESRCSLPKNRVEAVNVFIFVFKGCFIEIEVFVSNLQITPGSSGGIVTESSGKLVGIAVASGEGFSFLVTLEDIQTFLKPY